MSHVSLTDRALRRGPAEGVSVSGSVVNTARSLWIAGELWQGAFDHGGSCRDGGVRAVATDLQALRGDFADRVVDEPREVGAGCCQRFRVSPCSAQHEAAFDGGDE